jgi:hypothetical protein
MLCHDECTHCHRVEARTDIEQVWAIAAVAAAGWEPVTLRTEQLNDPDVVHILQEVETGQRPEWKDMADNIVIILNLPDDTWARHTNREISSFPQILNW